jgi:hypothetical protein
VQSDITGGFERSFLKTRKDYRELFETSETTEFAIYADNILEGMTVLNSIAKTSELCQLEMVILEPMDQPMYVFKFQSGSYISIIVCGAYSNWLLPHKVQNLVDLLDLPDFVIYKIQSDEVVFAGELTETGSVGNSQWQREGRKVAAARLGIPFVYKTVYSEFDESQRTVREPTSLLVYASILYSLRYRANSFVLFEEPNRDNARIRERENYAADNITLGQLVSAVIHNSLECLDFEVIEGVYSKVYKKMLAYLAEPKIGIRAAREPRIEIDFPQLSENAITKLSGEDESFIDDLATIHLSKSNDREEIINRHKDLVTLTKPLKKWTQHLRTHNVSRLASEADFLGFPILAPKGQFKIGLTRTRTLLEILSGLGIKLAPDKLSNLLRNDESVVFPLRLHKSQTQWSPDPETGEVVSFAELFTLDLSGNKVRNFIGVVTVDPPQNFDLDSKRDSKLYKALRLYSDVILLPDNQIISANLEPSRSRESKTITSIDSIQNREETEEIALVSTMLALTKVLAAFELRYIAINHGSWQQIELVDSEGSLQVLKINRDDPKLDLVLQDGNMAFILAEGKKEFRDIFRTAGEVAKIKSAMQGVSDLIRIKSLQNPIRVPCFIFNIDIPEVHAPEFLKAEYELLNRPEFKDTLTEIANGNYFLIAVYRANQSTKFLTVFSDNFPHSYKKRLEELFTGVM